MFSTETVTGSSHPSRCNSVQSMAYTVAIDIAKRGRPPSPDGLPLDFPLLIWLAHTPITHCTVH